MLQNYYYQGRGQGPGCRNATAQVAYTQSARSKVHHFDEVGMDQEAKEYYGEYEAKHQENFFGDYHQEDYGYYGEQHHKEFFYNDEQYNNEYYSNNDNNNNENNNNGIDWF